MILNHTEEIRNKSPFIKLLGLAIEKFENGYCQSLLEIKDSFLNKHKAVHGGVIYSMADISMGVTVYSTLEQGQEAATIEIKINYLKPAQATPLLCETKIIQKGRNIAVVEAEITQDNVLVAKAIGTFSIFKTKIMEGKEIVE
jgi:acyl-CoA thioesterase